MGDRVRGREKPLTKPNLNTPSPPHTDLFGIPSLFNGYMPPKNYCFRLYKSVRFVEHGIGNGTYPLCWCIFHSYSVYQLQGTAVNHYVGLSLTLPQNDVYMEMDREADEVGPIAMVYV